MKKIKMVYARTEEEILSAIYEIRELPAVAVDTETTDLRWWAPDFRPFYISFAADGKAWGFPFPEKGTECFKIMKTGIFGQENQQHIYHNAKFDLLALLTQDVQDCGEVHDTMILSHLRNENVSKSLDSLGRELGIPEEFRKSSGEVEKWFADNKVPVSARRYDKLPQEILEPYAVRDTVATWMCWEALALVREEFAPIYYIERAALPELVEMERGGYRIDVPHLRALLPKLESQAADLRARIRDEVVKCAAVDIDTILAKPSCANGEMFGHAASPTAFNLDSQEHLAILFFDILKVPKVGLSVTEKGKVSLGKYSLEKIAHPVARLLEEWRTVSKLAGSFVSRLPDFADADGFLHGQFHQVGTVTGRMASSDPNMQNIPPGDVRRAFVPREGFNLFFFDYSQVELRVLAHYCQDPTMVAAFKEGRDLHTETAARLYGKPSEAVTKEERQTAKKLNFTIVYGGGSRSIANQLKWSEEKAKSFLNLFFKLFPGIKKFRDEATQRSETRGWVRTWWGRHRRPVQGKSYTALNGVVSGTATGDMPKIALPRVGKILREAGGRMVSIVHDEIQCEIPLGAEGCVPRIVEAMEDFPEIKVPVKVDVAWSGKSWADKKEWKPEKADK